MPAPRLQPAGVGRAAPTADPRPDRADFTSPDFASPDFGAGRKHPVHEARTIRLTDSLEAGSPPDADRMERALRAAPRNARPRHASSTDRAWVCEPSDLNEVSSRTPDGVAQPRRTPCRLRDGGPAGAEPRLDARPERLVRDRLKGTTEQEFVGPPVSSTRRVRSTRRSARTAGCSPSPRTSPPGARRHQQGHRRVRLDRKTQASVRAEHRGRRHPGRRGELRHEPERERPHVAFVSAAPNLVRRDTNDTVDVFVGAEVIETNRD